MVAVCLICGCSELEVQKLHYFPRNSEKCKIWMQNLGMEIPSWNMRNERICSNHFTSNDYVDQIQWKLKTDAVPLKFIVSDNLNAVEETIQEREIEQPTAGRDIITTPSIKKPIFRGISNLSRTKSTPRKQRLMKVIECKEASIRRLKKLAKARAHNIKELSSLNDSDVVKELFNDLPNYTANFLISQIRCSKTSPKGRRWTMEEKVVALALLKRGPKCYNLLRKIVSMPSKKTLLNLLQQVPFNSGVNEHMLRHIDKSIKNDNDRICSILMDEMDIKEHIQYDSSLDRIRGFEEITGESSKLIANKALVFMVKGLQRNWKQPIAYYFSHEAVSGTKLSKIIIEVVEACQCIAKLDIVAIINDCGTNNIKALKTLGSSMVNPYIIVGGQKIFNIYDPPHLLKCTASLFRKYNVEIEVPTCQNAVMQARFNDVRKAYEIDSKSPLIFRAMHKIRSQHMEPKMKYAMKVNIAAQILSRSVSSFLYTLLSRGELEQRSIATATFINQVDELFDSFNGSGKIPPPGKQVKCILSNTSAHMKYWKQASKMVKSWRFVRFTKKGAIKNKPPSQVAWMTTLVAIRKLWVHLSQNKNFEYLKPRNINQDALENLFGAIRSGLGNNDNPTTLQFVGSLKTQILNGLINLGSGRNCEEDDGTLLSNLGEFLKNNDNSENPSNKGCISTEVGVSKNLNVDNLSTDIANAVNIGSIATMSVAYVAGFIIKSILKFVNCEVCNNILLSNSDEPHNLFISFKEWDQTSERLVYPSEEPVISVGTAITLLEDFLETHCNTPNISRHLEKELNTKLNFSWIKCTEHKNLMIKSMIKGVIKIGIPWWCKRQVRDLKDKKKTTKNKKMQKFLHN